MEEEHVYSTWLHSDRFVPRRFMRPVMRFTETEAASGVILLIAAAAALIWANAPFGETYDEFWHTHVSIELGSWFHFDESLQHVVNDGLMVIFFFVVGLEIKRELVIGELRDPKAAALPAVAALGGMIFPALVYVAFVASTGGEATAGWGIPMATDIAFSVGVVALLGSRVPIGAKLFLLALAIADDIGAITVIAIFYTDDLSLGWLAAAIGGLVVIEAFKRSGVRSMVFYVPAAVVTWYFLLESGVHATLAGVALGLMTPARPLFSSDEFDNKARRIVDAYPASATTQRAREHVDYEARQLMAVSHESIAPLSRLEHRLHIWSSFAIVPIFALANAGVRFAGVDFIDAITHPVALGVTFGLVFGKMFGITLFTYGAVRLNIGRLPKGTTWSQVWGLALLAGIGFTVALFISSLAFDDAFLTDRSKIGIFAGSLIAGIAGYWILKRSKPTDEAIDEEADTSL
ncbi:MAG: Na+/H+ antiporter NhaA [Acidimicrobiia bacterium]